MIEALMWLAIAISGAAVCLMIWVAMDWWLP